MRRREFITLLGGAAAWPVAARTQQAGKIPRIGFLGPAASADNSARLAGLRQGLRDLGYVEGMNIIIDYRWAEGNYERLQELAADLVRSNVDVILTSGTPGSLAAKRTTTTIPIVMANAGDPVAAGLVASIARPGGNITGQSSFSPQLYAKRIELLKEVMPRMTEVAILFNSDNAATGAELQAMETAALSIRLKLQQFPVRASNELESAFDGMVERHLEAVGVSDDGMLNANLGAIAALATKRRLLSVGSKELAQAGGLIGYGINYFAAYRRAAVFVDKILKGTKPADLPIEQAAHFEFVLNLKAAKVLSLAVPTATLLRADEVIE
jgi:putative tryptophan/tyrosine transport system substrate-binding protein